MNDMSIKMILPLVSWENGIWMIGLFAVVCILIIGAVFFMMSNGNKSE